LVRHDSLQYVDFITVSDWHDSLTAMIHSLYDKLSGGREL